MVDTHLIIIICMYVIFIIVSMRENIRSIKRTSNISIMNLCKFMYIVTLAIIPIVTYLVFLNGKNFSVLNYDDNYIWTFYMIFLCTVFCYYSMCFGYSIKQVKRNYKKINISSSKISILMSILIFISIVSLLCWAYSFGGVSKLITNANSIRAGFISANGNTAFFKHFVPISMIVSFVTFKCLFINKIFNSYLSKLYNFILFSISIFISNVYIIANDGRMLAGVYIGMFLFIIIKNEYNVKKTSIKSLMFKISVFSIPIIMLIINADTIFRSMKGIESMSSYGNNSSFLESLSKEFSFTLTGTQQILISNFNGNAKFTIFNDLINGLFAWIPTSIKPAILTDVWDYNTILINSGGYGQSPTSIVAQSIYDLGFLGVFIIPFIYGFIIRRVENRFYDDDEDVFIGVIYILLGFYLAKGIPYFSIYNIMINIFFIVISYLIYRIIVKIKVR